MSRWRPDPWRLVVGEHSCVLARNGTGSRPTCLMTVDGPWSHAVEQLIAGAAESGHKLDRLEVVVVGTLAQHWSCQAPQGAASLRELRAYASARRQQQFGETLAGEWWVEADWRATGGFICMAVPQALVELIAGVARPLRLQWAVSTDMALLMMAGLLLRTSRGAQWTAIETPQGGLLWHADPRRGMRFMRAWRHGVQVGTSRPSDAVQAEWRRAQLRADESTAGPLTWLRADVQGLVVTSLTGDGALSKQPAARTWSLASSSEPASWLGVLALHGGRL